MYYNEFFENTGECETSFFLGCRDCKSCRVELYNEINMLRKALRELEKIDIIETAMTVVNRQIKEKMEEINNNSIHDKTLIDTYKSFFKINLESMTEEEIDCIELTVYTDCQPW